MNATKMKDKKANAEIKECPKQFVLAVNDTLQVISGKWKLPIIASLLYGKSRFTAIKENIENITPRMLSKELKELEINGVVKRMVHETTPVQIEYTLTDSGKDIVTVLDAMVDWGIHHREAVKEKL